MCVACREIKDRTELLRFVKPKESRSIVKNPDGKHPGKGYYICRDRQCWERLWSRRNLKRSIALNLDPQTVEWVERSLGGKDR